MCQLSFTQLNEFSTSYTRTRAQLLRIPCCSLCSFIVLSSSFCLPLLLFSNFQFLLFVRIRVNFFLSLLLLLLLLFFFYRFDLFLTLLLFTASLAFSLVPSFAPSVPLSSFTCYFLIYSSLFAHTGFPLFVLLFSSLSLSLSLSLFSSVSPLFVRRLLFNPLLVLLSVSLALNVWPCPSICLSVSLTLQLTELALSLSSAYSPSYSVQRKWYGAVPRSTRIAYVCNTLVTTEHKHRDSVYSVNELHTKKKKKTV